MQRCLTMRTFHSLAFKIILFIILFVSAAVHATAENNDVVDNPAELAHPEQVHLSLGDKPDQMVVTWVTMTKRKSRPRVKKSFEGMPFALRKPPNLVFSQLSLLSSACLVVVT